MDEEKYILASLLPVQNKISRFDKRFSKYCSVPSSALIPDDAPLESLANGKNNKYKDFEGTGFDYKSFDGNIELGPLYKAKSSDSEISHSTIKDKEWHRHKSLSNKKHLRMSVAAPMYSKQTGTIHHSLTSFPSYVKQNDDKTLKSSTQNYSASQPELQSLYGNKVEETEEEKFAKFIKSQYKQTRQVVKQVNNLMEEETKKCSVIHREFVREMRVMSAKEKRLLRNRSLVTKLSDLVILDVMAAPDEKSVGANAAIKTALNNAH